MFSADTFSFTSFTSLPPELRNQIWIQSLPHIGPAAFIYKQGCWTSSKTWVFSAPDFSQPQGEELELRFCHDTLARIPLELPLLLACQEARAIALTWAYNQYGAIVRRNGISKIFGFSRDVLYISLAAFDEFCKDPYDKWETDLNSDRTFMSPSSVRKITVHAEMFDDLWNTYSFGLMLVSI